MKARYRTLRSHETFRRFKSSYDHLDIVLFYYLEKEPITRIVEYLIENARFYCWMIALVRGNVRENNARSICGTWLQIFPYISFIMWSNTFIVLSNNLYFLLLEYYSKSVNYLILYKLFVILLEKIFLAKFENFQ